MNKQANKIPEQQDRQTYDAPEIILEIDLETRAGSTLPGGDPLDLTGVGTDTEFLP